MNRFPILGLFSLVLAVPALGQRHYVIEPRHVLSDSEKGDLAARGIEVQQALSAGRYLVRAAPGVAVDGEPLTPHRKIERTALREATSGKPFADVNVFFFPDVEFDSAKNAIEAAGGTMADPLQVEFRIQRLIGARIPSTSLSDLAADERVMLVYGPRRLRQVSDNQTSAQLSNVDIVQGAPYSLSGQGVHLSFFELGAAEASHPEFGGRLHVDFTGGSTGDREHATHVAGTIIAAGIDARARGMAPNAELYEFDANDHGDFAALLTRKQSLGSISSIADSNSWGYVIGWCTSPSCTGWEWQDSSEYYGAYDAFYVAGIDRVARASNALMVHSAGNDASKVGPTTAPFAHTHVDSNGETIPNRTYCYSENGSGTDCPAPTCTAGFCETVRHPQITSQLPAPWLSVGLTASAKNVLTVGAVDSAKNIGSFSSRGPTRDGRVKPEIVARGVVVYSTKLNGGYGTLSGTSMSTPAVTGTAALMIEQWRRTFGGANPAPIALKTLLLAGAQDLGNPGPDYTYGFGLLDAKASADLIVNDMGQGRRIRIDNVAQGATFDVPVNVTALGTFRVVLGWNDPEVVIFPSDDFAISALVNDLDLKVIAPDGQTILPYVLDKTNPERAATRGVNTVDNVEEVEVTNAAAGTYRIRVTGTRIAANSPQQFAVVANAEVGATAAPCLDVNEPNNSTTTASGSLASQQTISGRTCDSADVDFYKFTADRAGAVSVSVISADTPLRVTLTSSVTAPVTADVAAAGTRTLTTQLLLNVPVEFFVRVEPIGTIGGTASYTVTPSFSHSVGKHRRAVRR